MANTNYAAFAELFKSPAVDVNKLFDNQRRNVEALSAAVQVGVESAQALSRRGAEVLRDHVEQTLKASRELFASGTPEASLAKQAELARTLFESNVVNFREMTELFTKTSFEAFDVLNRRASEAMHEVQSTGTAPNKRKH